jgi:CheY-like chemotaxis protein
VLRLFAVELKASGDDTAAGLSPAPGELSILVVDDDADVLDMMDFLLRRLGFNTVLAGSVEEAQDAARGVALGLIISDLGLPGESGLSLIAALGLKHPVPAVALSGHGSEQDMRSSRAMGFAEHLVKPVTPDKLREVVGRLMGSARRSSVAP